MNLNHKQEFWRGLLAVSPIAVFALFYLVVSIVTSDFYSMPLSVAFIIASIWAVIISPGKLRNRIDIFSQQAACPDILYMIWIFILAGAFASLVKELGAVDATVSLALQYLPVRFVLPGMFLAACFISFSIGTSVGTVVALTPLCVELAQAGGISVPLFVAAVIGGAFFGDNLSFISDTTIAATRSQGCNLKDKFYANVAIVVPAAIITLIILLFLGSDARSVDIPATEHPWLIIPYLIVIGTAIAGVNVLIVLLCGIVSACASALFLNFSFLDVCSFMGSGVESMGSLITITLLAGGMLGLIKANGGIDFILRCLSAGIKGRRGAQAAIALLTGCVNLCTANNTVAIITVGPICRDISERYGISARRSASLLDTASCVVQCLIPYGAQTLLATAIAGISPVAPWPYLIYAWALLAMMILAMLKPSKK